MFSDIRFRTPAFAVTALLTVLVLDVGAGQGKGASSITLLPAAAAFSNTGGVRNDGGGPYIDGTDGVSSLLASGSGSTNGWVWDLAAKRSRLTRSLVYDLTNPDPVLGGNDLGVITIHTTHGQIYDLAAISEGETTSVRASFHLIINRVEYVLRFGQTPGDGSAPLIATRSGSSFWIRTDSEQPDGDLARYLQGNGPGEILLGYYHVPVDLTLTVQH